MSLVLSWLPSAFSQEPVPFDSQILPLLRQHCFECHGDGDAEAGLRLNSLTGINAGGKSGAVLVPGSADESLLISAVRYGDESLRMPPEERLAEADVDLLVRWVNAGAVHPEGPISAESVAPPFDVESARRFWAFQPVQQISPPDVTDSEAVWNAVDAFVVARLRQEGIRPNDVADRRTLIRRATLDLTGLPPDPADVAAFLADESPDAFTRLIDRLLASPAYGERWGRHWLDVVRYADSNGLDENVALGNAWRYRDYVIRAFNDDKPFDQFLREQLAGDLLVTDQTPQDTRNDLLIATGMLSLGPKVLAEGDEVKLHMDIVDEQIDTLGRAFLGLTFGCARCHHHKFDPVSQADYYALAGIFESTRTMESLKRIARWNENELVTASWLSAKELHQKQVADKESEIRRLLAGSADSACPAGDEAHPERDETQLTAEDQDTLRRLREELAKLKEQPPAPDSAMGVADGPVHDSRIHHRGSHLSPGRVVPRGFPVVLDVVPGNAVEEGQSGRLQLADWLTHPAHPLTARVIANRIWRWHFGRGLVVTTENFGLRGTPPDNQPLLDWLAGELVRNGWSLKSLHRTLMLSRTWQLSATERPDALAADPENQFWWRFSRRRLEAEAIRDSILAVSGRLDRTMGGSLLHVGNREFIFDHTSKDGTSYDSVRRSVYLPVIRNNLYDGFSLFDYTDASVPNGNRSSSTVASQSLFLMNGDPAMTSARALADRLLTAGTSVEEAHVQSLYERCLCRPAAPAEVELQLRAVADFEQLFQAEGMKPGDATRAAFSAVCQSMLMSSEFVYLP